MSKSNPSSHRIVSLADSPAAARVADPVLSTVARGYRNAAHAHTALFPIVDVTVIGGQIVAFGAEAFAKRDLVRAPGADMQLLEVGYAGEPYTLEQRALAGLLPIERLEEGQSVPGIDLGRVTAARVLASISLQVEIKAADLATASGNYSSGHTATLSGSDQWDHKGALPAKKVKAAKETVLSDIGLRPNTLVVSGAVHNALTENPDVVDRVKHVSGLKEGVLVNEAALANYFDVEHYVVGRMTKGEPGDFSEIWGQERRACVYRPRQYGHGRADVRLYVPAPRISRGQRAVLAGIPALLGVPGGDPGHSGDRRQGRRLPVHGGDLVAWGGEGERHEISRDHTGGA